MKDINLVAVRERLPRGSINQIAETLGLDPKIVSHVFKNGWYSEHRDKVIEVALSIIRGKTESSDSILSDAEELGLTTTSLTPIKKKKQSTPTAEKPGFADLFELTREELAEYISENGLETDPEEHSSFWKGSNKNRLGLIYAICDELDLSVPDWDEVHDLDRDDLEDVVDDMELDIDTEDFNDDEDGNKGFADAICEALGLEEPEESEDE